MKQTDISKVAKMMVWGLADSPEFDFVFTREVAEEFFGKTDFSDSELETLSDACVKLSQHVAKIVADMDIDEVDSILSGELDKDS